MNQTMQQKSYEFEMHKEQMKQIQMQAVQIQRQAQEIEGVKASLIELKKIKTGSDAFVPLGAGVFASGKITDISEVLVLVGGGIGVKKSVDDVIRYLDSKLEMFGSEFKKLDEEAVRISKKVQEISRDIEVIAAKK